MKFSRFILAALLAAPVLTATPLFAAPAPVAAKPAFDPAAVALLDQSAAAYARLGALAQSFTSVYRDNGKTLAEYSGNGAWMFLRPDKALVRAKIGGEDTFALANGDTVIVQEESELYVSYPVESPESGIGEVARELPEVNGFFMESLANGVNPLLEEEPMVEWGRAIPLATAVEKGVELTEQTGPNGTPLIMRIYLDSATNLVTRIEGEMNIPARKSGKGTPQIAARKYSGVITFTPNAKPITPALFEFVTPPGATLTVAPPEPDYFDPRLIVGAAPFALTGKTLQGQPLSLDSYKGKVVLLDFWATWCGPCIGELPNVRANYDKYHAQGFDVVAVSLDQDETALRDFVKERKLPWTQILDGQGWNSADAQTYGVKGIPFSLLIGRDGKIAAVDPRGKKLEPAIEAALNAQN